MAEGVGTYGLKGAGTQGISGEPNGGGLYSRKIPTVTISKRVPGVIVSDGTGHAKVYQSGFDAFRGLTNILGTGIGQQVESHLQQQFGGGPGLGGHSFAVAQSPEAAVLPNSGETSGTVIPASDPVLLAGRRLQQATILENISTNALSAIQERVVAETSSLKADIARATQPGELPTITSTQDGTVQLLTNNNSGDEVQFRKDGTFTFVNGGDSPGIFSVGPKGVHFEKDNIFKSRMYAARAPASGPTSVNSNSNLNGENQNGNPYGTQSGAQYGAGTDTAAAGGSGGSDAAAQNSNTYSSTNASPDANTYSNAGSGQTQSVPAPTNGAEAQNSGYTQAPVSAPAQEAATTNSENTQTTGNSQQEPQQSNAGLTTAAYSSLTPYASSQQAGGLYSGVGVAQAPIAGAAYGPSQAVQPQNSYQYGSSIPASSLAGAQAPSVQAYVQNPAPVEQSYFGTGALVAPGPSAYAPSVKTLSTSAYSATVPSVQASGQANKASTGRQLPTSADVFNLGQGIASLLGRRLLAQG